MSAEDLSGLLDEIVTLPSAPTVLLRITKIIEDPAAPFDNIAEAISADPSISMKVLRLANSAYYGVRQRVGSLSHAISLLGLKVIKNLVLTATVFRALSSSGPEKRPLFSREQFWLHCLGTGLIARILARSASGEPAVDPEEAFAAGLLHDVGKIILEQHAHKKFEQALEKSAASGTPLYACEQEIIGVNHAVIGGKLAEKWNLPKGLVRAISYHHSVENEGLMPRAAAIVNLADYICYAKEIGQGGPSDSVTFAVEAWNSSGFNKGDIITFMGKLKDGEKQAAELLNLAR
jgi:putative nucleotidyltransferase with HDIG domain